MFCKKSFAFPQMSVGIRPTGEPVPTQVTGPCRSGARSLPSDAIASKQCPEQFGSEKSRCWAVTAHSEGGGPRCRGRWLLVPGLSVPQSTLDERGARPGSDEAAGRVSQPPSCRTVTRGLLLPP